MFNFESIARFMQNPMDVQLYYLIWKVLKAYTFWGKEKKSQQIGNNSVTKALPEPYI